MIRPKSFGGALPRLAALGTSLAMLLSLAPLSPPARAATVITVDTTAQEINGNASCSLQEAIYSANLDANLAPDPANPGGIDFVTTGCAPGNGADTIVLPTGAVFSITSPVDDIDNPVGPTGTPVIYTTIVIEGNGALLQRTGAAVFRAFAVASDLEQVAGSGDLTIRNLHIKNFF